MLRFWLDVSAFGKVMKKESQINHEGNCVQATIKLDTMNKVLAVLEEGSCYRIGNFGVGKNGGKYLLLNHRYKINFYKNTSITRCQQLECYFYEDWAEKFNGVAANENDVNGPVIMILQRAKVKYFNGGSIRESGYEYEAIVYVKVHKIHRENGWTYIGCKRCGSTVKEIDSVEARAKSCGSSSSKACGSSSLKAANSAKRFWWCKKHELIEVVDSDEEFPNYRINRSKDEELPSLTQKPTMNHIDKPTYYNGEESDDELPLRFNRSKAKKRNSILKTPTMRLIDEPIDDEFEQPKPTSLNYDFHYLFDNEADEDLQDEDLVDDASANGLPHLDDFNEVDDDEYDLNDSFIDDGPQPDDSTEDDNDTDN
uniref:Replication protein A 70 kDa DNA-binding subunit B n=1 Tax=Tanacetum cinerariifolium TaxID=118510 RepID=A0A6L2L3H2_TANCI|nr:replication protein A 70 kDa DNA-binding subunit B [Tanacetum cinerariifolium]